MVGLNGTIAGVVLVHAVHGLVIAWIAAAAFAAIDPELELAARNVGGLGPPHCANRDSAAGDARSDGECHLCLSRIA